MPAAGNKSWGTANDETSTPMIMESTPLVHHHSIQDMENATWTRRRGKTAEADRLDSSSGSDLDEEERANLSTELSPDLTSSEREQISSTSDTDKASISFATVLAADEEEERFPSPRRQGMHRGVAAFLSSAHGLEQNFEKKVSMTPPARMSTNYNESPFNNNGLLSYPATDARRNSIPRSHAFGPFAPLPLEGVTSQTSKGTRRAVAFNYRSALAIDGLPDHGGDGESSLAMLQGESLQGARHARSKTEGIQKRANRATSTLSEARKRAATMLKSSNNNPFAMEVDDSEENDDAPPPSPSPAVDLSFPKRFNLSEGDSSTESEGEGIILRPGARVAPRKMGSNRSISTSQCQHDVPSMIGFGGEIPVRSYTTSALKNSFASQSSLSTSCSSSKFSSQGLTSQNNKPSSSPYKTPNKRRARMPSSNSVPRSRTLSAASPVNTPIKSEEGSLFASSSNEFDDVFPEPKTTSRENKRRSTGSCLPSTSGNGIRLFSEASPAASLSSPSRSKRASLPPASPTTANQRRLALSRLDNSYGSPAAYGLGFDDSGVAFTSPATSSEKLTERALGKHLGLGNLGRGSPSSKACDTMGHSSPSKAAFARRTVTEQHQICAHPFSVRERSALANETRMSDGGSSVASSPDPVLRKSRVASASSVPEGLTSPARLVGPRRTSLSANSLAVGDDTMTTQAPYLTPQNYKNVIPLQTAFMSTGLASKRNRPTMGNVDLVTGEAFPPLPPKLNYTLGANTSNSNTQLGLREVMAAANAHSAAINKPTSMPDTPMKRPGFPPFAVPSVSKALPMGISSKAKNRNHPTLPSMLSPPKQQVNEGNDSSSSGGSAYGGDSPLLNQDCDSPTLGLASVSGKNSWTPGPQRTRNGSLAISPTQSILSQIVNPSYSTSPEIALADEIKERHQSAADDFNYNNLSTFGFTRPTTLRRGSAAIMHRPASIGLQRKGSFGPASEQGLALSNSAVNSPVLGSDFVPTTPTRNSASIKWFEGEC